MYNIMLISYNFIMLYLVSFSIRVCVCVYVSIRLPIRYILSLLTILGIAFTLPPIALVLITNVYLLVLLLILYILCYYF